MINFSFDNGVLTLGVSGRIDSVNASAFEAEVEAARATAHTSIVVDVEDMAYTSSAGLRVFLRLRKNEPTLKIINASAEVYDIFEMTGFTEMIPIEKAYRQLSVEGCTIIGQGAKGTVYRYNTDTIVKVYKNPDCLPDIMRERELARKAFVLGVPTAISYDVIKVGKQFGSVFELLDAKSLSQLIAENPDKMDAYVTEFADMLRLIHGITVKTEDMPNVKDTVHVWCETARRALPAGDADKLDALVNAVPDIPHMLHFDYHTNNLMNQNGETLCIDMDTLCYGHPIFELANVYITYVGFGEVVPSVVEKFLGMPYALAVDFWNRFLPKYLGTTDAARIAEVSDKVRLLSYTRLLRHTLRRGGDDEASVATLNLCKQQIAELLTKVSALTF